jgi:hypothetical protein
MTDPRIEAGSQQMVELDAHVAVLSHQPLEIGAATELFTSGLAAADAVDPVRVLLADTDRLTDLIRDEISGWPIGTGYYQTSVSLDEARDMTESIVAALRAAVTPETTE